MPAPRHPDPRIPIQRGGGGSADVYLLEGDAAAPPGSHTVRFVLPRTSHFAGCACCAPRGPAAVALATLFRARATGAAPYFNRVILLASPAGAEAVQNAIDGDAVAGARYVLLDEAL